MSFQIFLDPSPPRPPISRAQTLPSPFSTHPPQHPQQHPKSLFSTLLPTVPSECNTQSTTPASRPAGGKENLDPFTGLPASLPPSKTSTKGKGKAKRSLPANAESSSKPKSTPALGERRALAPLAAKPSGTGKSGKAGKPLKRKAPSSSKPPLPSSSGSGSSTASRPAASSTPFNDPFCSQDTALPPLPSAWPRGEMQRVAEEDRQLRGDMEEQFDRLARELTVLPLADVSEAYGVQPDVLRAARIPLPPSPEEDRIFRPFLPQPVEAAPLEEIARAASPVEGPVPKRARLRETTLPRRAALRRSATFDGSPTRSHPRAQLQESQLQQQEHGTLFSAPACPQLGRPDAPEQPSELPSHPRAGMSENLPIWEDLA